VNYFTFLTLQLYVCEMMTSANCDKKFYINDNMSDTPRDLEDVRSVKTWRGKTR